MLLSENALFTKVADYASAATSDVTSASVDMTDYDSVIFLISYGTPAANNLIHAECSSDDGSSDTFADLEGSEVDLSGASDEDQWLEIHQPPERYVRCVAQRGTSSTLENIWAIQFNAKSIPTDNLTSGTIYGKSIVQPAEGTK